MCQPTAWAEARTRWVASSTIWEEWAISVMLFMTASTPWAACCILPDMLRVTDDCSSTAEAILEEMLFIWLIMPEIELIALTA